MIGHNETVLTRPLQTPLGTFTPGVTVLVLDGSRRTGYSICLDLDGIHHAGRCHRATVPAACLGLPKMWRPEPRTPTAPRRAA